MKGLFLGAGASYECGMPLVLEFTNTLRENVLKRIDTNLFNFIGIKNQILRLNDNKELKEKLINYLMDKNLHYEQVIGELEKMYLLGHNQTEILYPLLLRLIETIQLLLFEEQQNTIPLFSMKILDFYGIKNLLDTQKTLNVFSLNHDLIFEEICLYYNLPLKDGFYDVDFTNYDNITKFKTITGTQLKEQKLNLFNNGEYGINLLKLHGSFDIFATEDKNIYLKATAKEKFFGAYIKSVQDIEKHSNKICKKDNIRGVNELFVEDCKGEEQFLRRSLLSGANKFKGKYQQIAPVAFFEEFKKKIYELDEISAIGYGFGDSHINEVFDNWLSNNNNKLIIHDPYRTSIPPDLLKYEHQISIINEGFTDFFMSYDNSKETISRKLVRYLSINLRKKLKEKRESETFTFPKVS